MAGNPTTLLLIRDPGRMRDDDADVLEAGAQWVDIDPDHLVTSTPIGLTPNGQICV
jgi:hypothetical protein